MERVHSHTPPHHQRGYRLASCPPGDSAQSLKPSRTVAICTGTRRMGSAAREAAAAPSPLSWQLWPVTGWTAGEWRPTTPCCSSACQADQLLTNAVSSRCRRRGAAPTADLHCSPHPSFIYLHLRTQIIRCTQPSPDLPRSSPVCPLPPVACNPFSSPPHPPRPHHVSPRFPLSLSPLPPHRGPLLHRHVGRRREQACRWPPTR